MINPYTGFEIIKSMRNTGRFEFRIILPQILHRQIGEKKRSASPWLLRMLLSFATDIACGMSYLHSLGFMHGDLAARNCLVGDDFTIKISNFGQCRHVTEYTAASSLPKKQSSPEHWKSLEAHYGVYGLLGDVWSYGVVLWEIMSFGAEPYTTLTVDEITTGGALTVYALSKEYIAENLVGLLEAGHRLVKPEQCPDLLMQSDFPMSSTKWKSVALVATINVFTGIQFSIFFTSMWPYLQEIDTKATESFFGYIAAGYSIGQALSSPVLGWWSNRLDGKVGIPALFAVSCMLIGNAGYTVLECAVENRKYLMLISRIVTGIGAGIVSVTVAFMVAVSSLKDRSRAMSIGSGAFGIGMICGPGAQLFFTPFGYPGIDIYKCMKLNIYTAPAIFAAFINLIMIFCIVFVLEEPKISSYVLAKKSIQAGVLPQFDRLAAMVIISTRFAQMFVVTNQETIGAAFLMMMFAWTRSQVVTFNSAFHLASALLGFVVYLVYIVFDLGTRISQRLTCIMGLACLFAFHLVTFSWPWLPGQLKYRDTNSNQTNDEATGCDSSKFTWCTNTTPINLPLYIITYTVILGIAFPLINVTHSTIYSTILGPRNQGTMQGLLLFSGSFARVTGPILIAIMFTEWGPRAVWILQMAVIGFAIGLWLIYYRRLVPLRTIDQLSSGEAVRNRYGHVYRF